MLAEPDWDRVANVLIAVSLRLTARTECGANDDADSGVLQGVNRRAGCRGILDRGAGGKAPGLCRPSHETTVITDPGWSGKNLERPGLQQLLEMVEAGHVSSVLLWRLDRLSWNLGDLILMADRFGQAGVALHSFSERIDLSSATGRMFYNVLGSFAQFYREQLAENVCMGMAQAMRQGRWRNRPPTGYDLVAGTLTRNDQAAVVRNIFALRAEGASQGSIAEATGVKYSTVLSILKNRAYLGEIRHRDDWLPGLHEPLVTADSGKRPGGGVRPAGVVEGICSPAEWSAVCGGVRCPSTRTGRDRATTGAGTVGRAVSNRHGRTELCSVLQGWVCGCLVRTWIFRRQSVGSWRPVEHRPGTGVVGRRQLRRTPSMSSTPGGRSC